MLGIFSRMKCKNNGGNEHWVSQVWHCFLQLTPMGPSLELNQKNHDLKAHLKDTTLKPHTSHVIFAMDLERGIFIKFNTSCRIPSNQLQSNWQGSPSRHLFRDITKWLGNIFPTFIKEDHLHTKQCTTLPDNQAKQLQRSEVHTHAKHTTQNMNNQH